MSAPAYTLGELARRFALELRGDASLPVHGVATKAACFGGALCGF